MSTIIRTCEYCHKSIDHRGPKAKTCSNTCKQYAMEVRQGKREPVPKPETEQPEEKIDQIELENQLADLEKTLTKSDNKLSNLKEQHHLEYPSVQKYIWENFRIREKRNDFLFKHFLTNGEVTGNDLQKYGNTLNKYPFEDLNQRLFAKMGRPTQPFLAAITGKKDSGKTILGIIISITLATYLKSKVLHVLDFENKNKATEYYQLTKTNPDNLLIKHAETYTDIKNTLAKDTFEFLVLDSISGLKLKYENLRSIKKEYPKLSIFFVTRWPQSSIMNFTSIEFKTEIFDNGASKGAFAKVFTNGITGEDQEVDIFKLLYTFKFDFPEHRFPNWNIR